MREPKEWVVSVIGKKRAIGDALRGDIRLLLNLCASLRSFASGFGKIGQGAAEDELGP